MEGHIRMQSASVLLVAVVAILSLEICTAFSVSPSHAFLRGKTAASVSPSTRFAASRLPLRATQRPAFGIPALRASAEFEALKDISVTSVETGASKPVVGSGRRLIAFLTHFGDLSSWEYAQQLRLQIDDLKAQGVEVIAIGIGGEVAAKEFAKNTMFPTDCLYFDASAQCCAALGFEPGFGRSSVTDAQSNGLSPYLRLLPMLLGIGSPGTLGKVIYGYFGDRSYDPKWTVETLKSTATGSFPYVDPATFDALGDGYLRPFELATVRLQNMIGILGQWGTLIPDNQDLVVQQGGTLVMDGEETVYRFDDKGILVYTPVAEAVAAAMPNKVAA